MSWENSNSSKIGLHFSVKESEQVAVKGYTLSHFILLYNSKRPYHHTILVLFWINTFWTASNLQKMTHPIGHSPYLGHVQNTPVMKNQWQAHKQRATLNSRGFF